MALYNPNHVLTDLPQTVGSYAEFGLTSVYMQSFVNIQPMKTVQLHTPSGLAQNKFLAFIIPFFSRDFCDSIVLKLHSEPVIC